MQNKNALRMSVDLRMAHSSKTLNCYAIEARFCPQAARDGMGRVPLNVVLLIESREGER
jgi:hypothetical protein